MVLAFAFTLSSFASTFSCNDESGNNYYFSQSKVKSTVTLTYNPIAGISFETVYESAYLEVEKKDFVSITDDGGDLTFYADYYQSSKSYIDKLDAVLSNGFNVQAQVSCTQVN